MVKEDVTQDQNVWNLTLRGSVKKALPTGSTVVTPPVDGLGIPTGTTVEPPPVEGPPLPTGTKVVNAN